MIYEMRVYEAVPGRLPDIIKRFETKTIPIWQKHGIKQAGFFTTLVGEHSQHLTYFLAWESLADREKKWGGFFSDKERLAKFAETEKNGPLLRKLTAHILRPTAYSPMQ